MKTLIFYRLERAYEALEEANILLEKGHSNTFVNRLYYACFYAVSALLLTKDLSSSKHSGVRSLFHQHFVKTGIVKIEHGKFYDNLFHNRQEGDYGDFVKFNLEEVSPWCNKAKNFIEIIETIIKSIMGVGNFK
ncbi:MAG: HEPN domain-containing protein [bacterium]